MTAVVARSRPRRVGGAGAPQQVRVAIIGTGFAGLGMAIRLAQSGVSDFVVLERAADVGGTWRDNTYPGCSCDVPSHLYSFSFAPNPSWSRTYSPQPEIHAYLKDCAQRGDVLPHVRHAVVDATWVDADQRWLVTTTKGEFSAAVLVLATGALVEPSLPALTGLERFAGIVFHSARWLHDADLRGKRVAVIGTGASAIQFVPAIQPEAEQVHVFQRTPAWILPHPDRPIRSWERWLYRRFPPLQRLVRAGVYWTRELSVLGFVKYPRLMKAIEKQARGHLARHVPDPLLRAKLTPDYDIGCKRILLSNAFYPAVGQPNVEVVTDKIIEIRAKSIVTCDGVEREVDAIIFGTGFHVTDNPIAQLIRGRDGRSLAESWGSSPRAYLGTSHTGFPNLFHMTGPNTGLGHTSMVIMIEAQISYVLAALGVMQAEGISSVDVREDRVQAYNDRLDESMQGTVWTSGCASWYLDSSGRNSTLWPGFTWDFRRRTRRFDAEAYVLDRRGAVVGLTS